MTWIPWTVKFGVSTMRSVRLPLSNAPTVFMPEMHPDTEPMRLVFYCAWCDIKLSAVPDMPRMWSGLRYHPSCYTAAIRGGVL